MIHLHQLYSSILTLGLLTSSMIAAATDVLLITSDELAESWKPFAEWKMQQGKVTEVVSLTSIEENYEGKDVQEKNVCVCVTTLIAMKQSG